MLSQRVSRRKFLQVSAVVAGASLVACSGLTAAGLYAPTPEFPTSTGEGKMNNKVLVTYASWCGSTAEVAKEIASVIAKKGETVDLLQAKDVKDLGAYKSVVLGSAIRMGNWNPEAVDFVKRHQAALGQKTTTFFTVCMTLKDDTAENRKTVSAYTDPVRALVKPVKEGFFAGKMDYQRLNFFMNFLIRNMIKTPEGDFRNWEAIRAWAAEVA
jgi:menaquinone-dependent protoporphyrinogen oxidase